MDTLYSRFQKIAQRQDTRPAITVDNTEFSYNSLLLDVVNTAKLLKAKNISQGDCIVVAFANGYEFIVATLASFAVGATILPVNASFPESELEYYFDSCNVKGIFFKEGLSSVENYLNSHNEVLRFNEIANESSSINLAEYTLDENIFEASAIHMFSSGSTGKPKRITRTQGAILAEFDMMAKTINLSDKEVILCTIPLYHSYGFSNAMVSSLLSGSHLIILPNEFNGRKTINALVSHKVTIYPAVPFMYQIMAMVRYKEPPNLASCRLFISAGAPLTEKIYRDFLEAYGSHISQLYGSTETGVISINLNSSLATCLSVGIPLHGNEIEIRDGTGNRVTDGLEGEIWVKSPAKTNKYDHMPSATRECFLENWFFAGDLGVQNNERVSITGRKKLLINVAGNKVDPLEIEQVLESHQDIFEAVVIGKSHEIYGEQIKAYIVAAKNVTPDESDILKYAKTQLVEYKVPKVIEFIDEIPRSPLGKVLRKYL